MFTHHKRVLSLTIFLSIFMTLPSLARIRYVPDEYPSIQEGIYDCGGGDTVLVRPGTYYEHINFNGQYFTLASMYILTEDYSYVRQTIIDGDSLGTVITFNHNETSEARLIGFTIQNGFAEEGAGIHIDQSNPIVAYNIIRDNNAHFQSGGEGGGIYCYMCSPLIINNLIVENTTTGIYGGSGGGIYCDQAEPIFINNTITLNHSSSLGGGIRLWRSDAHITNAIIWNNFAEYEGINVHVTECTPTFSYCDIYSGWPGEGNINTNPEFRDPTAGDFHLMSTAYGYPYDSQCIDAGNPLIYDERLDSLWGLGTSLCDIGAYGGSDSLTSGIDYISSQLPAQISLAQNYPNPFNPFTSITFSISEPQHVTLQVYDILGREIETLIEGYHQSGTYSVQFDATAVASGLYFYRLQAGDMAISKQMMLLK
ncbi:MAG: T9SS type A sorting domain-containing protein [candidate division Zixibacteria bacterium]|nr:T9SS type A sorting domain-containing protein [candidate division Zixibacteria bacterium]